MSRLRYPAALVAAFTCTVLQAAEPAKLETVTVNARPPGLDSLEHIAQPVNILTGDELDRAKSASLGETLLYQPGMAATGFGPFASRPIIRGLGGSRVQVLQGGIGTLDVSTISVDHAVSVDPFQARQIEVFRGPATLLYGSAAAGGLVNISSGRIPEQLPAAFTASAASRFNSADQEKLFSFRARGGVDNLALHLDGTLRNADDYESARSEIINSAYDSRDINMGGSYIFADGFAGISFGRLESTHEIPFDPAEPDEIPFIETKRDRFDLAALLHDPLPGFSSLRLRAAHSDYQHIEFEGPGEPPGTTFANDTWEARLEMQHNPVAGWYGSLGTQLNSGSLAATGDEAFIVPVDTKSAAVFLLEETDYRDWHVELGGRFEHQTLEPAATGGFSTVSHNAWSVAAGAHWHFTPRYSLGLSLSRSDRIPSQEELFANGPHLATGTFEIGNPDLSLETANNIDLSLQKEDGRLTWALNLFFNYIEDFIFLQTLDRDNDGTADRVDDTGLAPGELLLTGIRQEDAIFYGGEATAKLELYKAANSTLSMQLLADYVRAQRTGGSNLPRISPARIGSELHYSYNNWHMDIAAYQVFKQTDVATLETDTDGYLLLNADMRYSFKNTPGSSSVFWRASNLLNEDARRHTSFIKQRSPLPGRSLLLGIQINY